MHRAAIFILTLALLLALSGCGSDAPSTKSGLTYVGTVNSNIYHHPHCKWAKKISSQNLVGWKTTEEAIADGRRACKVCKP